MLYKLSTSDGQAADLQPLEFLDFADLEQLGKDLEELIATHLLDTLFEDGTLMPISRERSLQPEADVYALDRAGDVVIFELKRGNAGADAMLRVLRHAQEAGQWTFDKLEARYRRYAADDGALLAEAHREAFALERALPPSAFNARQRFLIVGNAANDALIDAIDYWKRQGLVVDFLPYRIYQIAGQRYFEFFALPHDRHQNPALAKGVLFDTSRSYDEAAIWDMMEQSRVAAYGDAQGCVDYLNPKDVVLLPHMYVGIIAAAEVVGPAKSDGPDKRYRDVRFVTPVPKRGEGIRKFMSFADVRSALDKEFFWARTMKVPYLNRDEARLLFTKLEALLI